MPWICFERDYFWANEEVHRHGGVMFKKGMMIFVTGNQAERALKAKAARPATDQEIEHARRLA